MQLERPPITEFSVHVAPLAEGGTDIAIFGELDLATVQRVQAAVDVGLAAEGPVVIDMRACGFVDSSGIAVIVKAALRLREQDRQLVIRGVQDRVQRILDVSGLTSSGLLSVEPEQRAPAA